MESHLPRCVFPPTLLPSLPNCGHNNSLDSSPRWRHGLPPGASFLCSGVDDCAAAGPHRNRIEPEFWQGGAQEGGCREDRDGTGAMCGARGPWPSSSCASCRAIQTFGSSSRQAPRAAIFLVLNPYGKKRHSYSPVLRGCGVCGDGVGRNLSMCVVTTLC